MRIQFLTLWQEKLVFGTIANCGVDAAGGHAVTMCARACARAVTIIGRVGSASTHHIARRVPDIRVVIGFLEQRRVVVGEARNIPNTKVEVMVAAIVVEGQIAPPFWNRADTLVLA